MFKQIAIKWIASEVLFAGASAAFAVRVGRAVSIMVDRARYPGSLASLLTVKGGFTSVAAVASSA